MNAVAEQAFAPEQPVVLVDVGIVARLWMELQRKGNLGVVFRQVRLHVQIRIFAAERARHFQLLMRRGDGEARRDGIMLASLAVPIGDQRLAIVISRLRCIEHTLRRVTVHHHLAGDVEHVAVMRLGEERFGGLLWTEQ